jgi:hypothetical protein
MQTNCRKKPLTFGKFIAKLRAATASHVPAGYEDKTGFHYGANAGDGSFLIYDSGEQPFFQRGSSPPPPWRLPPGSAFGASKTINKGDVDNNAL